MKSLNIQRIIEASLICVGEEVAEETGRLIGKGPEKRFGLAQAFGKKAKEAITKKKKEKKQPPRFRAMNEFIGDARAFCRSLDLRVNSCHHPRAKDHQDHVGYHKLCSP